MRLICWLAMLSSAGCDQVFLDDSFAADGQLPFDPQQCGTALPVELSPGGSRYLVINSPLTVQDAVAACEALGVERASTHLAALESLSEIDELMSYFSSLDSTLWNGCAWIGAVQAPMAPTPASDWNNLTGAPLAPGWQGGQPDDGLDMGEQGIQQFSCLKQLGGRLVDAPATSVYAALCECDDRPVVPAIRSLFGP